MLHSQQKLLLIFNKELCCTTACCFNVEQTAVEMLVSVYIVSRGCGTFMFHLDLFIFFKNESV